MAEMPHGTSAIGATSLSVPGAPEAPGSGPAHMA